LVGLTIQRQRNARSKQNQAEQNASHRPKPTAQIALDALQFTRKTNQPGQGGAFAQPGGQQFSANRGQHNRRQRNVAGAVQADERPAGQLQGASHAQFATREHSSRQDCAEQNQEGPGAGL
jgi:hypothetical protein